LKTLRFKYFVLPAQLGGDGRRPVLRISAFSMKVKSKMLYLFNRIGQYFPPDKDNCNESANIFGGVLKNSVHTNFGSNNPGNVLKGLLFQVRLFRKHFWVKFIISDVVAAVEGNIES
jgi:hypothetical protein